MAARVVLAAMAFGACGGGGGGAADVTADVDGMDDAAGETVTLPDGDGDAAADAAETEASSAGDADVDADVDVDAAPEADGAPGCDAGDPLACDDGDPCTDGACVDGACIFEPRDGICRIGASCFDDGTISPTNKCLRCDVAKSATAWSLVDCDDGDACSSDGCTTATGCTHVPENGVPCDDGVACSQNDTCKGGVCKGSSCGCVTAANCAEFAALAPPCTAVVCASGLCEIVADPALDGTLCDAGFFCEIGSTCAGGVCGGGVPVDCSAFSQGPCRPGVCEPTKGCVTQVLPDGTSCSDGKPCTGAETCVDGLCEGSPLDCDDGNACNGKETCDPASGCKAGTALKCDDGNTCNGQETCDPAKGCVAAVGFSCDDNNLCNGKETCDAKQGCLPGSAPVCDDGNPCNGAESCHPVQGCVPGSALKCSDGDVCNGLETCQAGKGCVAGVALSCTDGDACNGVEGCDTVGGCKPGAPLVCDDGDVCNGKETCAAAAGCVAGTPVACSDGDACNGVESCGPGGACLPGAPPVCDDGEPCNGLESCDANAGCVAGKPVVCADADPCNGVETCDALGQCQPGTPPACAPFACTPAGCNSSCANDGDCAAGAFCDVVDSDGDGDADECIAKSVNGSTCSDASLCASGYCQSGVCCGGGVCCQDESTCPTFEPTTDANQPFTVVEADVVVSQVDGAAQQVLISKAAKLEQVLVRLSGPGAVGLPVKLTMTVGGPPGAPGASIIALADFVFNGGGDYPVNLPAQPQVDPNTTVWLALTGTAFSAPPCDPTGCNGPILLWQGSNAGDPYPAGTTWLSINGGATYTSVPAIGDRAFQVRVRVHGCTDFRCATP
jgi:hypothetical protein